MCLFDCDILTAHTNYKHSPQVECVSEGERGIFKDGWKRYKRMTALTDTVRILDKLWECCGRQLNTRLVQMHSLEALGSCDETNLLEFIKAVAVRGVHKKVCRAIFQGIQQQPGEMYQSWQLD